MDISLFEVVGPIMMGPSSSATAGMARVGVCANRFLTEEITSIDLKFTPRLAIKYAGNRSHLAIIGGVLGMAEYDPKIMKSLEIAKEKGIRVTTSVFKEPAPDHMLTVQVTMGLKSGGKTSVTAVSVGGGSVKTIGVEQFTVDLSGTEGYLFLWAEGDIGGAVKAAFPGATVSFDEKNGKFLYYMSVAPKNAETLKQKAKAIPGVTRVHTTLPVIPLGYVPHEPMFTSYAELEALCDKTGKTIPEIALEYEAARSGRTKEDIWAQMAEQLRVMKKAKEETLTKQLTPLFGFESGNDCKKLMAAYQAGKTVGGSVLPYAVAIAIGTMEYSCCQEGCIVAVPTGGSSGILPGAILPVAEERGLSDEKLIEAMFVAAVMGAVMYYLGSTFSGSAGGCQAEVGVSSGMAAGALTYLAGGTTHQIIQACTIGIKNIVGLICDPFGCTEVPCIKRNGIGVANAFASADMAIAGIDSYIPPDQVMEGFIKTQKILPVEMRGGGCGVTGTAKADEARRIIREKDQEILLPLSE